ncbi:MAG: TetR/AcrR family transcriptional regulator [Acidimicrobiales bacterium]
MASASSPGRARSATRRRSGAVVPASSVYWHLADKDALFAEVIQQSFDRWWASMPSWQPPPDESERLG